MARIVGIDLGTTNSLVAVAEEGTPRIIAGPDGSRMVPSVIHFGEDQSVRVGNAALEKMFDDSGHTIFSIKRFMGKGLRMSGMTCLFSRSKLHLRAITLFG